MKGISTILATILIVIIVVALVSLTYTFAIGLFGTSTKGAEGGVTELAKKADKRVVFVIDPSCTKSGSDWKITFIIRHDGATYNITHSEIPAFFGSDQTTLDWTTDDLAPGTVKTITATNVSGANWAGQTRSFTVSAPANPISKTITCPS